MLVEDPNEDNTKSQSKSNSKAEIYPDDKDYIMEQKLGTNVSLYMPEGMVVVKMVESNVLPMPILPDDIDFNTVGLNSISPESIEAEFNYDPY